MLGDVDLGSDSIIIEITATKMRLTLEKGKGQQVVYDRKDAPLSPTAETDEVVFLSSFEIKSKAIDGFILSMIENQKAVRAEKGSLEMRLFQGVDDPGIFYVFGRTDGQAGLEEHMASVAERGIEANTEDANKTPPIARHLGPAIGGAVFPSLSTPQIDGELIVAAVFDCKAGMRERVIEQYKKQIPNVRANPDCLAFNAWPVLGTSTKLAVYERWRSPEAGHRFSTTDKLSIETGEILGKSVNGQLSNFIVPLNEIDPYIS